MVLSDRFAPWPQVNRTEANDGDHGGPPLPHGYQGIDSVPPAYIRAATQQPYQHLPPQLPAAQVSSAVPASQPGSSDTHHPLRQPFHPAQKVPSLDARGQIHIQPQCYDYHHVEGHGQHPHHPQQPAAQLPPSLQKLVNSASPPVGDYLDCCSFDNCLQPSCLSVCDGFVDCEEHDEECTDKCMDDSCPEGDASCLDYCCPTDDNSNNNHDGNHRNEGKAVEYLNDYPFFDLPPNIPRPGFSTDQEGQYVTRAPEQGVRSLGPTSVMGNRSSKHPITLSNPIATPSSHNHPYVPWTEDGQSISQSNVPLQSCQSGHNEAYNASSQSHALQQPCCLEQDAAHTNFMSGPPPYHDFAAVPLPSQGSSSYQPPKAEWTPCSRPPTAAESICTFRSDSTCTTPPIPCSRLDAVPSLPRFTNTTAQPAAAATTVGPAPFIQSFSSSPSLPASSTTGGLSFTAPAPPPLLIPFTTAGANPTSARLNSPGYRKLNCGRAITSPLPSPMVSVENRDSQQADSSDLIPPAQETPQEKPRSMVRASVNFPLPYGSPPWTTNLEPVPKLPPDIFSIPEGRSTAPRESEGVVCQCILWGAGGETCGMVFSNAADLQQHLETRHSDFDSRPGQEGHRCQWKDCQRSGLTFSQKGKLHGHYLTHSDRKYAVEGLPVGFYYLFSFVTFADDS